MENASKALIIAGAILISIMIIGLGVAIYSQAKSNASKANLNPEVAQAQNEKFTTYFGSKVSSSEVKSLMSAVRTNNITGQNSDDQKTICVLFSSSGSSYAATDPSKVSSSVKPGKKYTVETNNSKADDGEIKGDGSDTGIRESDASYYTSGYIRIICIKEN